MILNSEKDCRWGGKTSASGHHSTHEIIHNRLHFIKLVQHAFQRNSQKSTKANTWIYDSVFWIAIKIKVTSYRDASLTTKTWIPLLWPTCICPGVERKCLQSLIKQKFKTQWKNMLPVYGIDKGQYQNIIMRRAQQSIVLITVRYCVKSWWQQLEADVQQYCQKRFLVAWKCPSIYCHPNCSNPQATVLPMCWNTLHKHWLPSDQYILAHHDTMRDHQFAIEHKVKEMVHIQQVSQLTPFTAGLYTLRSRRATSIQKITLLHIFYCCCVHCGYFPSLSYV